MAITNLFEFADSGLSHYQVCEIAVMESESFGYAIYFCGPDEQNQYYVQFNMTGMDMYATVDVTTMKQLASVFRSGRDIATTMAGNIRKQALGQWRTEQMFPIVHSVFDFSLYQDPSTIN